MSCCTISNAFKISGKAAKYRNIYSLNFKVSSDVYLMYNRKKLVNTWVTFWNILIQKKDFCCAILCPYSHHKNQKINFVFFFFWKLKFGSVLDLDRVKLVRLFQQTSKSSYFGKLNQNSIISFKNGMVWQ